MSLPLFIVIGISLLFVFPRSHTVLGIDHHGVPSYQNKGSSSPNYYDGVFTGLKYQCVEYARRWLLQVKGYTFTNVDHAYEIYDLPEVVQAETTLSRPFLSIPSTSSDIQHGDLIIYRKSNVFPHGHVAVASKVDKEYVYLSEQNYSSKKWKDKYARKISKASLNDGSIIGWKRIK